VRRFVLALKRLQRGEGPTPPHVEPADLQLWDLVGEPALSWDIASVSAWLRSDLSVGGSLPEAADECERVGVSGEVLLSLEQADIYSKLQLTTEQYKALEVAIEDLRAPTATCAAAETLTAEMVTALTGGGQPCAFPLAYLRRCTGGFDDDRIIGEGAFGTVYRSVDPTTGVRSAVKRVNPELVQQQQRMAAERSMQRELKVLTAVQHPCMIRLLGHCFAPPGAEAFSCLVYEYGAAAIEHAYGAPHRLLTSLIPSPRILFRRPRQPRRQPAR
jgi:hypothetical protein